MKTKDFIYLIYSFVILTLTFYFSLSPNEKSSVLTPQANVSCPCKKIGKELPKCPIIFMKPGNFSPFNMELVPNTKQIFDGMVICIPPTEIRINSYGFRDYEYSLEKPPNVFRIVVLGDSITFGQGVELSDTYPKVLEKILKRRSKKYEVLNFGVPSYNVWEKVEVFRRKAKNFNPDLIIFQYLNDDIINWKEFRKFEKKELLNKPKAKIEERIKIYQKYLRLVEKEKFEERWQKVEEAFAELKQMIKDKPLILLVEASKKQTEKIKKIAEKYGWYLIDLSKLWRERKKLIIHPLDPHPNPLAHKILAKKIYELLVSSRLLK